MVPKRLGEDLCSLHQHVDRLAFSVIWTMDERANITSTKFHKTVICSEAALSYGEAQLRMAAWPRWPLGSAAARPPVPPRGAPGGSGAARHSQREAPAHWAPRHRLGSSCELMRAASKVADLADLAALVGPIRHG